MYGKKAFNLHFSTFFTPKRKNPRDSVPLKQWLKLVRLVHILNVTFFSEIK